MKVICFHTGTKYPPEYSEKLYKGLARNTTKPLNFEVIRQSQYPTWWGRLEYFNPPERILILDIDLVITGNVDFLDDYRGSFCSWNDPYHRGKLAGSVYALDAGFGADVEELFRANADKIMRSYYSDQEFLRDHISPDFWADGLIQSYKANNLVNGPGDARIVVFHGSPKPHELHKDSWVWNYWR